MRATLLAALAAAVLAAGCVPVTEPVGDIEKAEPDETLLGAWKWGDGGEKSTVRVDAPAVKGNPKGLMRATPGDAGDKPLWFFVATVGKGTYGNVVLDPNRAPESPNFGREGAFAAWQKGKEKRYFVFRYALADSTLTVDAGNEKAFKELMAAEKLVRKSDLDFYPTPAGWLTKYLDRNGPDTIFDGSNTQKYTPAKKK